MDGPWFPAFEERCLDDQFNLPKSCPLCLAIWLIAFCIMRSLKREKVVWIFKLNTGQDDHAIMFLEDYSNQIVRIEKRMQEKKLDNLEVFEWFKTHVIDFKLEPSIEHQELWTRLLQWTFLSLGG